MIYKIVDNSANPSVEELYDAEVANYKHDDETCEVVSPHNRHKFVMKRRVERGTPKCYIDLFVEGHDGTHLFLSEGFVDMYWSQLKMDGHIHWIHGIKKLESSNYYKTPKTLYAYRSHMNSNKKV